MEKEMYYYCVTQDPDEGTIIHVTPKSYWEEEGCQIDSHADDYIVDAIESICDNAFSEDQECVFGCMGNIDTCVIVKELNEFKDILTYCNEFEEFMN